MIICLFWTWSQLKWNDRFLQKAPRCLDGNTKRWLRTVGSGLQVSQWFYEERVPHSLKCLAENVSQTEFPNSQVLKTGVKTLISPTGTLNLWGIYYFPWIPIFISVDMNVIKYKHIYKKMFYPIPSEFHEFPLDQTANWTLF